MEKNPLNIWILTTLNVFFFIPKKRTKRSYSKTLILSEFSSLHETWGYSDHHCTFQSILQAQLTIIVGSKDLLDQATDFTIHEFARTWWGLRWLLFTCNMSGMYRISSFPQRLSQNFHEENHFPLFSMSNLETIPGHLEKEYRNGCTVTSGVPARVCSAPKLAGNLFFFLLSRLETCSQLLDIYVAKTGNLKL